jgi:Trp operon repressor
MSNSLLEHLSAINDLVEEVLAENAQLKKKLLLDLRVPSNRKKLSKREAAHIRELKRNGLNQASIAQIYDVNPATISRIVRGQYHK